MGFVQIDEKVREEGVEGGSGSGGKWGDTWRLEKK
jgi:hypothetical protein